MERISRNVSAYLLFLVLPILVAFGLLVPIAASASSSQIDVWWPTNGAHISGTQPFKAMIPGLDPSQYQLFWQVDGGQWNWMSENGTDSPHLEASVDVSSWSWHGSGPYIVNFIARDLNGSVIAQQSETVYIDNGLPAWTAPAAPQPQAQPQQTQTTNTLAPATAVTQSAGSGIYVATGSDASAQETIWKSSDPSAASAMATLAAQPTATWFGNWNSNVHNDVRSLVSAAQASGTIPVLVAYNIPERDCGGFSSGGSDNPVGYESWIDSFAQGLDQAPAVVILEPDALAEISCLSSSDQATREQLLSYAVRAIKTDANAKVYIDAGHSNWIDANTMAQELKNSGVAQADGFSLNVSNFMSTSDETAYGEQLSALTGGKHFVIDTSRNGNGSDGQWCNPPGMAIGDLPTLSTGNSVIDAYLWIKIPGESDGSCNGGPSAGTWWPSYALSLVQNSK